MSGERSLPRKLRTERRQTQPVQLATIQNEQDNKADDQSKTKESQIDEKPIEMHTTQQTKTGLLETDF